MRELKKLEEIYHQLADTSFVWFPFTKLRLAPKAIMTWPHLLKMTFCFGPYMGGFYLLKRWLQGAPIDLQTLSTAALGGTALMLIWFSLLTRPLWNRRARRLQAGQIATASCK